MCIRDSWGTHGGSQWCQQSTSMHFQALWSCAKVQISRWQGDFLDWLALQHIHGIEFYVHHVLVYHVLGSQTWWTENSIPQICCKANQSRKSPLSHKIHTLAQDWKAWKHMKVSCWHHWKPPWMPQPSRERERGRGLITEIKVLTFAHGSSD